MPISTFQNYLRAFFPHLPAWHWVVLGILTLTVSAIALIKRKRVYGAIALGLAVGMGLALPDALVFIRIGGLYNLRTGFNLAAEWHRLLSANEEILMLMFFNLAVFVPFGALIEEALAAARITGFWKRLAIVALIAFTLSLCIESLQLILKVGMFEVTDLVLNTAGAVLGGLVASGIRRMFTKD